MRRTRLTAFLFAVAFIVIAAAQRVAADPAYLAQANPKAHAQLNPMAHTSNSSVTRGAGKHVFSAAASSHGKAKVAVTRSRSSASARSSPASSRVRRGALAAARRKAHAQDAARPVLGKVRLAMPAPMRGSHESLVHQNVMAEADGLERIQDEEDLRDRIAHGSLVPVPVSAGLHINGDLPEDRRYCRPWTAKFLSDFARAHSAHFGRSALEVTSAVRTVETQRRLRMFNRNAAAADGDIASPHLTGGTIDVAKQGLSWREIGWIRAWLMPLEQAGQIDVEEEFRQSCFHISVYKGYTASKSVDSGRPLAPLASASVVGARGR